MARRPTTARKVDKKRKVAALRRRKMPKVSPSQEIARLKRELGEALERQKATGEILAAISRSSFNLQDVLETLVQSAARLAATPNCFIFRREGNQYRLAASHGFSAEYREWMQLQAIDPGRNTLVGRAALEARTVHLPNILDDPDFTWHESIRRGGFRAMLGIPLLSERQPIGVIAACRPRAGRFTKKQIELVSTFADQAVIAIENARLFDEVQAKTHDLAEALVHQTSSAEILRVIASSPSDVHPVMKAIVKTACELCGAYDAVALLKQGDDLLFSAHHGPIPMHSQKRSINRRWTAGRAFVDKKPIHVHDLQAEESEFPEGMQMARDMGHRSIVSVPLLREGESVGALVLRRLEVNPFNEKQIALLQTFADQAVIAIENARLFNETQEALERQTATADVLNVIGRSPTDAAPVFDVIGERAEKLCAAEISVISIRDGDLILLAGIRGINNEGVELFRAQFPLGLNRQTVTSRTVSTGTIVHVADVLADATYDNKMLAAQTGYRSCLGVPMHNKGQVVGAIFVARTQPGPFSENQIQLLQIFADQAVIAIQNVQLFKETQEALERQTATADILKVIASSPSDVQPVFSAIAERSNRLVSGLATAVYRRQGEMLHLMAFTPVSPEADAALQSSFPAPVSLFRWDEIIEMGGTYVVSDAETEFAAQPTLLKISRMRGWRSTLSVLLMRDKEAIGVITVTRVEPGGFSDDHVQLLETFADQAVIAISNVELFREVEQRTLDLSKSLDDLRTAQDRLIQTEKLASLGQLTAGIAHEIKNPLNFVNNFAALSAELVDEMTDVFENPSLDEASRQRELDEIRALLKSNLEKVVQHGKRADSIVKNMLLHSREGSGERRSSNVNALVDESLNLAYHGARAERSDFNISLQRDFDESVGSIDLFPQEITRALLNLISNGFYAVAKRLTENGAAEFQPTLLATTRNLGGDVEIRIRDNGIGIPLEVKKKMFNPFFTTKPPGEGTGLGLSMTHDIIVKQHGGTILVNTEPGEYTEFVVTLPRQTGAQRSYGA